MKNIDKIKYTFITVFTAINSFLGSLATPFYILVLTNILDYLTGIGAAVYRGERVSSETGFHGIAKKVCMWLLVLVGYIVDYIIISMGKARKREQEGSTGGTAVGAKPGRMKGNKQKAEYEEAEAKHGKPGGAEAEKTESESIR